MSLKYLQLFFCVVLLVQVTEVLANPSVNKSSDPTDNLIPIDIVIPGPLEGNKVRNPFIEDLLRLVFLKENYRLTIVYHKRNYTQGRALKELSNGSDLDLNWSTTSKDREAILRTIKFPLYRGLIGWRVAFIRPSEQALFSDVKTKQDLQQFLAVQRFDWTDYEVFKENQLPIEGNFTFPLLSKAITSGIADYFPRSVLEVVPESEHERNKALVIEKSLLFKYKAAYYFFVQKDNEALATILESGLEKAFVDGSYQVLFTKHFGHSLAKLGLDERVVIELNNTNFPLEEHVEKYWLK